MFLIWSHVSIKRVILRRVQACKTHTYTSFINGFCPAVAGAIRLDRMTQIARSGVRSRPQHGGESHQPGLRNTPDIYRVVDWLH
jgi:hypothetical protein